MNGAQLIVKAAVASGIEYCFANPGTTEILLALERGEVDGLVGYSWGAARTGSGHPGRLVGRHGPSSPHGGPGRTVSTGSEVLRRAGQDSGVLQRIYPSVDDAIADEASGEPRHA